MSEAPPEPVPQDGSSGGGNFLTRKYMGMPGAVWLIGAAVLSYFLFFRNSGSSSSGSSSGNNGTGGSITVGTLGGGSQVPVNRAYPVNNSSGGTSPDGGALSPPGQSGYAWQNPGQGSQSGTPNPQPTPWMMSRTSINASTTPLIAQPSNSAYQYYTAGPGDSLGKIASKYGISMLALAQANNLNSNSRVKPGQMFKIPLTNSSFIL